MTDGWTLDPPPKPARAKPAPAASGWKLDPPGWNRQEVESLVGPVRVTSEGRTPEHNRAVGGSPTSSHLDGQALDFIPKRGKMATAAEALKRSGVPFDQILEEGDHVHLGWGPKMRGQVRLTGGGAPPSKPKGDLGGWKLAPAPKPAAQPDAGWSLDPAPVAKPLAGKPAPTPLAPKPKWKLSDYAKDTFNQDVVQPWKKVGKDLAPPPAPEPGVMGAAKAVGGGLVKSFTGLGDLGGAVMSTLGAPGDALLARPYGKGMSALTKGGYSEEDARGAMNTALAAGRSPKGGAKMPKGEFFGKVRPFDKAPPGRPTPGDVYGAEKPPVERLDNALHRLRGNATADKLEVMQARKKVPKALAAAPRQEALYHELEQGMVKPDRKLTPEAAEALKPFEKYYTEQTDLVNDIRKLGAKGKVDVEDYLHDQGYVARRAKGHSATFDGVEGQNPDPVTGGNGSSLTKTTTALKRRVGHLAMDPVRPGRGEPGFITSDEARQLELKPGDTFKRKEEGPNGQPRTVSYTLRKPTTAEIEANTETRYHKSALDNTLDNVVRLRQVKRNVQLLDAATSDLKAKGLAHRDYWVQRNADGEQVIRNNRSKVKPGRYGEFVELPNVPQLKGWKVAPEVAEVFRDYKPDPKEPHWEALAKVNRALTSTIFWNPLPHMWNVTNHWAVARGYDWMRPSGYKSLMVNGARALQAVITKNEDYRAMLREGSALQLGDVEARNFHEVMLRKGVNELSKDRTAMSTLMHAMKLTGVSPSKLVAGIYKNSSKALWGASDVLMLQRQYELMQQGMGAREAIKHAEKDIPNYRIPSKVMHSRALSTALRDPNIMMFGRYRYGQVKAWGSLFEDLYKGPPEERTDAAAKFLVAMIIANGLYPAADKALQKATGNPEARLHRGGGFSIPDAAMELEKGQKSWLGFMSSVASPAPVAEAAVGAAQNRDVFGRALVEPGATPAEKAVQVGEAAADQISPLSTIGQAAQPGGPGRVAARAVGIDLPKPGSHAKGKQYSAKDAARRRKRDPLSKAAFEAGRPAPETQGWSLD